MKVALLSQSDNRGGAFTAAYRLHRGLISAQVDSKMIVGTTHQDDKTVLAPQSPWENFWNGIKPAVGNIPRLLYPQRDRTNYSLSLLPDRILPRVQSLNPDIVNIHWVSREFMSLKTFARLKPPIVLTLHDMWGFTGGCHYTGDCDRYITHRCGACPQLKSHQDNDLSRWIFQRKAKLWKASNMTIVSPSHWLADCARKSFLFQNLRIEVIPNGLDIQRYKPLDKKFARDLLNLPQHKQLILFGAIAATDDRRKGFPLLLSALQKLSFIQDKDSLELVIFGASEPAEPLDYGFKVNYLGKFNDEISLPLLYSAADVFVAPSLEDNLPNTIVESLACGTPCVAFKIGGMPDMIDHEQNGYLAQPFEIEDLAKGIAWILADPVKHENLRECARQTVEKNFTLDQQSQRYRSLFEDILRTQ